jgi:hypothetical protein
MSHFIKVEFFKEQRVWPVLEALFHTKSLNVLELAYGHAEIILSLATHTTHTIQPLDVSFCEP